MPRGAVRSLDERIAEIDVKIEKNRQAYNDLKAQRKELEAQKQAELFAKVQEVATARGISVEALLESALK